MTERRVRLAPEERRAQLIALGVRMLSSRTLDELSVEDLAEQAGISRGLLFHYFRSKQEFHLEVVRAAADDVIKRTAPDLSLPPFEQLRATIVAFVDLVAENPDGYMTLVRGAVSGDTEMRGVFDETRATLANRLIAQMEANGIPLSVRAKVAAHGWIAYCDEVVIAWVRSGGFTRDELIAMLTAAVPALLMSVEAGASDIFAN